MKKLEIFIFLAVLIVGALFMSGCNTTNNQSPSTPNHNQSLPNASTGPVGFKIQQAIVENNVDPVTNKSVSDHLEISLTNVIDKDISNMTVYYLIEDSKTNKNESYSVNLEGFVLKAHDTQSIHFDNENKTNHFWVNQYSLYYLSQDPLKFTIVASADGYGAQTIQVNKDAGGAEQVD